MRSRNIGCLTAARASCCSLANNHALDWGYQGLQETLRTLDDAGIARAGVGGAAAEATSAAALDVAMWQVRLDDPRLLAARPVEVVDSTGASDSFDAGFLFAVLEKGRQI